MKIVYLSAGAAQMLCGNCLRDNTLAAALARLGHEVLLVPTYTPLRTDETDVSQRRIFFGGINVFLQQRLALFRHTPWFVDRLLDSPRLLRWLSRRASTVEAEKLGDLTVSMILGEQGYQRKELDKLCAWLAVERPHVVHLSNAMMIGMAREIRRRLGVPVVCSLAGEDIFLEKLPEPYYTQARQAMRERAADCDAYVAPNRYYADYMADWMDLDPARVQVVRIGLNLEGHGQRRPAGDGVWRVGYFARICPEKGLHHLVEAFRHLCRRNGHQEVRLCAAGYCGAADQPYLKQVHLAVDRHGLRPRFECLGELDRAAKIRFLQSLDVLALPTVYRESKGISAVEALANGVPVVLPAHGSFPELVEETGGGLLHPPGDVEALADVLARLLANRREAEELGRRGREVVWRHYTAENMAQQTLALYEQLDGRPAMRRARGVEQPTA